MDSIEKSKKGFEQSFLESNFYNRQTRDENHLEKIISILQLQPGDQVLDLGTGSGYLAFAIAERYPEVQVTGLDIVTDTLERNKQDARERELKNINFITYAGGRFPFSGDRFSRVVSRYAFHHFPYVTETFQEIVRVLSHAGKLFISDPVPAEEDSERFVDAYMKLKDDGHQKFYTIDEFIGMAVGAGLEYGAEFLSKIRFPRKMTGKYTELLRKTSENIKKVYDIQVLDQECFITETVANLVFEKR